jgi:cytoskeletal protein CcmA (bactofilin family)
VWHKEDGNPQSSPEVSPSSMNAKTAGNAGTSSSGVLPVSAKAPACISQGIKIKGEMMGTEDLFIDGVVEGKVTLSNSVLTVGPNGAVKADIASRELVVRGRAEGRFTTTERIQIWRSARVQGDIKCGSIAIEDGAELRGKVEAGKATATVTTGETAQHVKKTEPHKTKDTSVSDDKPASGAASAGAD